MEDQEIICSTKGCICKPILSRVNWNKRGYFCIWHCNLKRKKSRWSNQQYEELDMFAITAEDVQFIEKAQEMFEQVFTQKEEREKDQFDRRVYSLLYGHLKMIFKSLLVKCREWRNLHLRRGNEMRPMLEHQYEKLLMSGVEKELIKEKDIYLNSYHLFVIEILTCCLNFSQFPNLIGKFSFGESLISTEETKESIHLLICEEIRFCIFESYYLIECVHNKKNLFQSLDLSKNIIPIIHAEKDLDRSFTNSNVKIKEPDGYDNNYLSVIDSFNRHVNACEIGGTIKRLDTIEENCILEFYDRCLKINSNLIFNYCPKEIKFHQLKEKSREPITDVNIEAARCQHNEECDTESFYYLPELGIQLCFKHKFHISYLLCSKYVQLFKLDLRQSLKIFQLLQREVCKESYCRDSELNLKLDDLIIKPNSLEHQFPLEQFILLQNEILINLTGRYESSSKARDIYDFEKILLAQIQNLYGLGIKEQTNYWFPTSNDYESDTNFSQNMLKIEILEYIMENRFPRYWRKKKVDSKTNEIIEYLNKDYAHSDNKELEPNFENIEFNIEIISPQKDKNDCFTDINPNMKMRLNCQNKSKKESSDKYSHLSKKPFEPSLNPSDSTTKQKLPVKNNSYKKIRTEKDFDQEPNRNCQLSENNYDDIKDPSPSRQLNCEKDKNNPRSSYTIYSTSSPINTSNNNSRSITGVSKNNPSSLGSVSKNLSEFNAKEECKAQPPEYSGSNNPKISEEIDPIKKYAENEIKDLIDEAKQAIYTQRKRYSSLSNHESLSEYFINKELYKLKLCDPNDPLLSQYDLSEFEEFREFASDPRWKNQFSITSHDKIKAALDTEKNIEVLSLIKDRPCAFEKLELKIHEGESKTGNNFLCKYFPENCEYFKITFSYGYKFRIGYYFDPLINLSDRVTEELYILRWKLSQHQMLTIFQKFKHVRSLTFESCILYLESLPEFGNSCEGSKIKELGLSWTNYGRYGYAVEHLIQGLSQSNDVIQNLSKIYITGRGNTEETKEKLKEYVDIGKLDIKLYMIKSA
ncbi:unnamed protein product [Moneuplotes crassus]|uniref:Uncharacterized protein n=1 Tax=Euplotes crassus TaxID=5936 RepID=A0AAD1XX17_EUPCR|nr:unnamed protein product [Moneuplotes crassus]